MVNDEFIRVFSPGNFFLPITGILQYISLYKVPLIIKPTFQPRQIYDKPVELVDLYPTLASLAGIPPPSGLAGSDLSEVMRTRVNLNKSALGQITRCYNCTEAYNYVIPRN